MQKVCDRHSQIEFLLCADARQLLDSAGRNRNLLFENLLVQCHYEHIMDVEALPRMHQNANQITEVVSLMAFEEIVPQRERFEDEADVLLVGIALLDIQGIVSDGNIWP